jgi:hypothetical protein
MLLFKEIIKNVEYAVMLLSVSQQGSELDLLTTSPHNSHLHSAITISTLYSSLQQAD